jgi:toxin HigB-1
VPYYYSTDCLICVPAYGTQEDMILSFVHKGLERFFKTGSVSGIQAKHADKLRLILDQLNAASLVSDMDFPGANLHPLKGNKKGLWSVKVNGNWRITFRFENGDAEIVDYVDYH